MEAYIKLLLANVVYQVLTYAQQSRERSNYEQAALNERMQEYKRQIDRESRCSSNGSNRSPNGDGIQAIGRSSHKMIEAVMQSAAKGKVNNDICSFVFDCSICFLFICWLLIPCLDAYEAILITGSNYSARLFIKTFFKFERRLETKVFCS